MTLPLPSSMPATVRCRGLRANDRPCRLVLLREPWRSLGMGEDCAERAGLVVAGRSRAVVGSGPNLLDLINQGDAVEYPDRDHDYAPAFGGPRPTIVTLCGSTRFKYAFRQAERDETLAGRLVISLGVFGQVDGPDMGTNDNPTAVKVKLDQLHLRRIDLADEIFVVNVGGYVGPSTRSEIAYAQATGKTVRYMVKPD